MEMQIAFQCLFPHLCKELITAVGDVLPEADRAFGIQKELSKCGICAIGSALHRLGSGGCEVGFFAKGLPQPTVCIW